MKLVVDPTSTRPEEGPASLSWWCDVPGTPEAITDADESIEGWIRACFPPPRGADLRRRFRGQRADRRPELVPVQQLPVGQGHTTRSACRRARPPSAGESMGNVNNGDGTVTWRWRETRVPRPRTTTATVATSTTPLAT